MRLEAQKGKSRLLFSGLSLVLRLYQSLRFENLVGTTGFEPATSSVSTCSVDCNSLKPKRTDGPQIAQKHPFLAFSTGITPEVNKKKRSKEKEEVKTEPM